MMVVWEGEAARGGFGGGTLAPAPRHPWLRFRSLPPAAAVVSGATVLAHKPRVPSAAAIGRPAMNPTIATSMRFVGAPDAAACAGPRVHA